MIIETAFVTKSDISGFMTMTLYRFGQMRRAAMAFMKKLKENQ